MKTVTMKNRSWHHRLATVYGDARYYKTTDICAYTRQVIKGLFIALFATVLFTFLAFPLSGIAAYIAACLTVGLWYNPWLYGIQTFSDVGFSLLAVELFIAFIGGIYFAVWWSWGKLRSTIPPPPSAVSEMYQAWHDKTCFKINIE